MTISAERKLAVLESARDGMSHRGETFICNAITRCPVEDSETKHYLRVYIYQALDHRVSYEWWLYSTHKIICSKMTEADCRKARIAWLDWMIEGLRAQLTEQSV